MLFNLFRRKKNEEPEYPSNKELELKLQMYAGELHNRGVSLGFMSDGYHTFDELYHHRAVLFSVICNINPEISWKSREHHDPNYPMYDGMFIVGIETPEGQATYHYDLEPYWEMFNVKELDRAPEWDGHTPDQAIERLMNFGKSRR